MAASAAVSASSVGFEIVSEMAGLIILRFSPITGPTAMMFVEEFSWTVGASLRPNAGVAQRHSVMA